MKRVLQKLMMNFIVLSIMLQSGLCVAETLKINGAGATFPYPIYSKWFSEYQRKNPDVAFNYQPIGSGGGVRQVINQTVDFGASDVLMTEEEKKSLKDKVIEIPTVIGAIAVVYNFAENTNANINSNSTNTKNLKLNSDVLAKIFLGTITKWNHPEIKAINQDINVLPDKDILIIRRSDGSGTTAVFTEYLASVSPSWKTQIGFGKSVRWPTGVGAKGNDGVANMVNQTPYSIGYVELAYAVNSKLKIASIKNKANIFIFPEAKSISNKDDKNGYPISAYTYFILPIKSRDSKFVAIKKFLIWAIAEGQAFADELHYAPLGESKKVQLLGELKEL